MTLLYHQLFLCSVYSWLYSSPWPLNSGVTQGSVLVPLLFPNCKYFLTGPCPITVRTSLYMFMYYVYICHFQWHTWYFTWRIKAISHLTCLKLSPDSPSILNMLPLESFPSQKMTTLFFQWLKPKTWHRSWLFHSTLNESANSWSSLHRISRIWPLLTSP